MGFIILGVLIGFLTQLKKPRRYYNFYYIWSAFMGGIIGLLVSINIGSIPFEYEIETTSTNIVSIADGSTISGSFFLGSGSIDGSMKFTYYSDEGNGVFKLNQKDASVCSIIYSDEHPRIETVRATSLKSIWAKIFAIPINRKCEYIFYIPNGSIKNNFALDAE